MAEACQSCRFWDVYDRQGALHAGELGDCRRHPPAISQAIVAAMLPGIGCSNPLDELEHIVYPASAFPVTAVDSWCGDYQQPSQGGGSC